MAYDLITVGSATFDVFAKTDNETIEIHSRSGDEKLIAYPLGTKILMKDLEFHVGGGGTNTAVAASRLGLKTGYLGNVGKDTNGDQVISLLKKEKVDFLGTRTNDLTNYSIILDSFDEDRTILVHKGASQKFDFDKIPKSRLKTKWFYLCAMVDKGFKQLEKISEYANKNNISVAFNPSSYIASKGKRYLSKILKNTDLLILNLEEAKMICGNDSKKELTKELKKLGPKNIIITDGKDKIGVLYEDNYLEILPKKVKSKETTGAGDSFGSTLVSGLIMSKDIKTSINMALKNSASVIMNIGAKKGLLTKKELIR
ncbi:carbohydrate kinase family protein [Candidatus Woesearchaeota archaeon]|nr:MAG: carbohydrate kinase family protein [Candidatus Woesearchaeota archaeon]